MENNIKCNKCKYSWNTKSKLRSVSCPNCGSKVVLKKIILFQDNFENSNRLKEKLINNVGKLRNKGLTFSEIRKKLDISNTQSRKFYNLYNYRKFNPQSKKDYPQKKTKTYKYKYFSMIKWKEDNKGYFKEYYKLNKESIKITSRNRYIKLISFEKEKMNDFYEMELLYCVIHQNFDKEYKKVEKMLKNIGIENLHTTIFFINTKMNKWRNFLIENFIIEDFYAK